MHSSFKDSLMLQRKVKRSSFHLTEFNPSVLKLQFDEYEPQS